LDLPRDEFLPYTRPWLGDEELQELKDTLDSGWLTTGPKADKFEDALKTHLKARNVVAVSSCTAAMHLSLIAYGVGPGDEVIVPDLSFVSDAGVVELAGAKPVLADVDPQTLTISITDLKRRLTPKTKAIIPVHYAGHPCELDEILELAAERDLAVIQDAAHAFGAEYKGQKIGAMGEVTCFSFHAVKNITGGEGGAVVTSDDELAEKVMRLRLFGLSGREMVQIGYKYNLSELHAALCLAQLRKLPLFQQRRERIAARYREALATNGFVDMPIVRSYVRHAWHLFVILLRLERLQCSRDEFKDQLKSENIGSQVHFQPIHAQPYFSGRFTNVDYAVTNSAYQRMLTIPLFPKMSDADVEDVLGALNELFKANATSPK
jgi:dTDP-4-amino-4,6-dideoxygalactose transaminase